MSMSTGARSLQHRFSNGDQPVDGNQTTANILLESGGWALTLDAGRSLPITFGTPISVSPVDPPISTAASTPLVSIPVNSGLWPASHHPVEGTVQPTPGQPVVQSVVVDDFCSEGPSRNFPPKSCTHRVRDLEDLRLKMVLPRVDRPRGFRTLERGS